MLYVFFLNVLCLHLSMFFYSTRWQILYNYSNFFLLLLGTKKAFLYIVLILSNLIMHNVLLKSRKIIHLIITSDVKPYPHHPCLCLFQALTFPLLPIFPLLPTRWHCPPIIQPKFIWKMHVTCACFPKVFQCFDLFQRTEDLTALMHLGKCTGIKKRKGFGRQLLKQ